MDDYLIIGAGLVGLATARALRERVPEARITMLEKAKLCRQGRIETVAFCALRHPALPESAPAALPSSS